MKSRFAVETTYDDVTWRSVKGALGQNTHRVWVLYICPFDDWPQITAWEPYREDAELADDNDWDAPKNWVVA